MNKLLQQIKSTKYLNAAALQCLIVSLSALTLHEIFQLKDRSEVKWGKERRGGGLEKNKSNYSVRAQWEESEWSFFLTVAMSL